jgi:hypothetical protein
MNDRQRADDLDNANLGRSGGHITHGDGTTTNVGSKYGPYAGTATNSDGSGLVQNCWDRSWHPNPVSARAPELKIGSSSTGGTWSPPTYTTPSYGGGGSGQGAGSVMLGLVALVIGICLYIYNRVIEAFQSFPVWASAYVVAWIVFIAAVFLSSRKIPWLIGSVAAVLLWPLGAWMFPQFFGMFAPCAFVAGLIGIIGGIFPYGQLILPVVLALGLGLVVLGNWDDINRFGAIGIGMTVVALVFALGAALPPVWNFYILNFPALIFGHNEMQGDHANFLNTMRLGLLPLLTVIGIFYAMRHKMAGG